MSSTGCRASSQARPTSDRRWRTNGSGPARIPGSRARICQKSAAGPGRTEAGLRMRILVVNAGSSTLKLRVLDPGDRVVGSSDLPPPAEVSEESEVAEAVRRFGRVDAVG